MNVEIDISEEVADAATVSICDDYNDMKLKINDLSITLSYQQLEAIYFESKQWFEPCEKEQQ